MFNKMLVLAGNIIYKKPTVHTNAPKVIVSFFSNAINPQTLVFNVQNVDYFNFETKLEKNEGKADVYNLCLNSFTKGLESSVVLAQFESKKEAEEALKLLRYKMYSPFKGFFKTISTIIVVAILAIFASDIVSFATLSSAEKNMREQAQIFQKMPLEMQKQMLELEGLPSEPQNAKEPQQNIANNIGQPPTLSEEELKALFEEASRLTEESNKVNQINVPNVGDNPNTIKSSPKVMSHGDAFLNSL